MSAFGPKRTSVFALHMSAFGGKADMAFCGCLLSRSLLGVKRTCTLLTQSGHPNVQGLLRSEYAYRCSHRGPNDEAAREWVRYYVDALVSSSRNHWLHRRRLHAFHE